MNDSAMTDNTIRLTKIDMDGQVYYSQFAFNLMLDKQKDLEAKLAIAVEAIQFARMVASDAGLKGAVIDFNNYLSEVRGEV